MSDPTSQSSVAASRILVKWKPGVRRSQKFEALLEEPVLELPSGGLAEIGVEIYSLPPGLAKQTAEKLMRHPNVEYAEVDGVLQGDPLFDTTGTEWHLRQIRALEAHALGELGAGARFGILDSGYKHAEPYFAGRIAGEKNFVNSLSSDGKEPTEDREGHGSACLALGIQVGPAAQCWVGRVMSANYASWSDLAAGALWVKDLVDVIACSIGGDNDSFTLRDAAAKVREKGVAWICAAGNQGGTVPKYPAATAGNFAIAATNPQDGRSGFSNFGEWVRAAAPGEGLVTVGGTFSGTSGACPLFAMVVAIVAKKFGITGLQAMDRVLATCKKLADAGLGAGRVDLLAALELATSEPPPPPPPPPPSEPPPPSTTAERLTRYATVSITPSNLSPGNETIAHGVDLKQSTKCLVFQQAAIVSYRFSAGVDATEIEVMCANDYPVRDPDHIVATGELADGRRELLLDVWLDPFTARFQTKRIPLKPATAPIVRLDVRLESSGDPSPGDTGRGILQFAELHPWGKVAAVQPPPPPPPEPEPVVLPPPVPGALADIETTIPTLNAAQRELLRTEINRLLGVLQ